MTARINVNNGHQVFGKFLLVRFLSAGLLVLHEDQFHAHLVAERFENVGAVSAKPVL
jgi:hypothetical protein